MFPSYYILGALQHAKADSARVGLAIEHTRDADDVVEPPRGGLPRLTTIEVRPEEVGPSGVKLDEASRAKLAAAGVDVEQVERELVEQMVNKRPESVSGANRADGGGWTVAVDVVELSRIPPSTDVLATYEVTIDGRGELVELARSRRYIRNQADEE